MNQDFDTKRIYATLKYGLFDRSKPKHLIIEACVILFLLLSGMTIGTVILSIRMANNSVDIWAGIGGIIALAAALAIGSFLIIRYILKCLSRWKEITLWMEDAVQLKAYSSKIKEEDKFDINEITKYRIRVAFKYDGIHYKFKSDTRNCWGSFLDKEIDILYSPKYREVILLKSL